MQSAFASCGTARGAVAKEWSFKFSYISSHYIFKTRIMSLHIQMSCSMLPIVRWLWHVNIKSYQTLWITWKWRYLLDIGVGFPWRWLGGKASSQCRSPVSICPCPPWGPSLLELSSRRVCGWVIETGPMSRSDMLCLIHPLNWSPACKLARWKIAKDQEYESVHII